MNSKMTLNLKQKEKQNNGTINNIIVRIYCDFNDHAFNLFSENKTRNE